MAVLRAENECRQGWQKMSQFSLHLGLQAAAFVVPPCPVLQYLVIKPTKPDGSPVFVDGSVITLNVTATTRGGCR